MISYRVDGPILVLTLGVSTWVERSALYETIRADPSVPNNALLLIDARQFQDAVTEPLLRQRFALLRQQLGPKLGQVCAILVSEQGMVDVRLFQVVAAEDELRHQERALEEARLAHVHELVDPMYEGPKPAAGLVPGCDPFGFELSLVECSPEDARGGGRRHVHAAGVGRSRGVKRRCHIPACLYSRYRAREIASSWSAARCCSAVATRSARNAVLRLQRAVASCQRPQRGQR